MANQYENPKWKEKWEEAKSFYSKKQEPTNTDQLGNFSFKRVAWYTPEVEEEGSNA